jgi:tetratricopeptide (TPR) repeat protein
MTVDHYLGNLSKANVTLPKPDPAVAAEVRRLLERSIQLADARLAKHPDDLDARFNLGAAHGVLASYVASVEGSLMSSFKIARRAYDVQEQVLERDPSRVSAGLVVGMYRYVVATMPWHMRMLAYIVGFGGGKERGIQMIEQAAGDPRSSIDARSALMILYNREGRYDDALRLTRELAAEVPRNRLFVLEEGATAIRAGKYAEADAALTRGLVAFDRDARAKLPGERSLLLYKRGLARVDLGRTAGAAADLRAALAADPPGWIGGRVQLELGRLADLEQRRADAITAYLAARSSCQTHEDKWCTDLANRYVRRPFAAGRSSER